MALELESRGGVEPAPVVTEPVARRRARPVLWWAALGTAAVAVQAYVYLGWITSDDFRSTPTGADPVPHAVKVKAWILQSSFSAVALAVVVWLVWRCVRSRRLTPPARIWLAWVSVIWLDPWANLIRPQMMFNSYYVNRGSWVSHIPWWISPHGHLLPQPFLIEFACYMFMVLISMGGARFMTYLGRRRPAAGVVGLCLPTWLLMWVFIFVIEELVVIRGGWVRWTSNIDALTLWHGTANAMPLTEIAFWAATITAITYQLYAYETRGSAPAERGLERVPVGARSRGH